MLNCKKILSQFMGKRILVVGDLILDHYIWGNVTRISPEAPVPVVEVSRESFLLGGAANVAHNIVSMGGEASVVGLMGPDRAGERLVSMLQEYGIICGGIFEVDRPTTIKTRVIAHSQQVVRFDREDSAYVKGKVFSGILDYIESIADGVDAVIISDYKKGMVTRELVSALVRTADKRRLFVSVDPKVGHFEFYKGVSLITPNLLEAMRGSGIEIRDEATLLRAGKTLLKTLRTAAVLITRGEAGMSLFTREGVTHIPTVAQKVYDVTGAGDTVIAAFTLAHAAGASMETAAEIANHAAGVVVGEVGTAVVTPQQILRSFR